MERLPLREHRDNLMATWSDGPGSTIGFTGHLDTVPLGSRPWSVDPFGGEVRDGRLYGRSASDMKSGRCHGRRRGWTEAARPARVLHQTHPDGGRGGRLRRSAAPRGTRCAGATQRSRCGEPTGNRLAIGHKGNLALRGEAWGVAAHASMPERGDNAIDNAIYKVARAITVLRAVALEPTHPVMGRPTLNVGTVRGGQGSNSVPDRAEFTVDVRTVAGQHHRQVPEKLRREAGDEVALEPFIDLPAVYTQASNKFVRCTCEAARCDPADVVTLPYVTDDGVFTRLGPGDPALAHTTDESCDLSSVVEAAQCYERIALGWARRDR